MAVITKEVTSYDLKGNKLSFAGWISNISPTETPFSSMIGKEAISQTKFQWQNDYIPAPVTTNAQVEGSVPAEDAINATTVVDNVTQIFRRGVSVSDTANVVEYYGRGKEVGYQMEKASLELKRDMEKAFLWQSDKTVGTSAAAAKTAGFIGLGPKEADTDSDTGAKTYLKSGSASSFTEKNLFDLTYQLYLANSKANIIMFHPKHAAFFGSLPANVAGADNRLKMFGALSDEYNVEVDTIVDPLGQKFALVPNRLMPESHIYIFNPADWTQMVLRAPKKIELAKQGSSQEWMIEAEVGLRHRNKFASGILELKA